MHKSVKIDDFYRQVIVGISIFAGTVASRLRIYFGRKKKLTTTPTPHPTHLRPRSRRSHPTSCRCRGAGAAMGHHHCPSPSPSGQIWEGGREGGEPPLPPLGAVPPPSCGREGREFSRAGVGYATALPPRSGRIREEGGESLPLSPSPLPPSIRSRREGTGGKPRRWWGDAAAITALPHPPVGSRRRAGELPPPPPSPPPSAGSGREGREAAPGWSRCHHRGICHCYRQQG